LETFCKDRGYFWISGLGDELAEDVQKREFLGLDAIFEFTTHFKFSFLPSTFAEEGSRKMLSWQTAAT